MATIMTSGLIDATTESITIPANIHMLVVVDISTGVPQTIDWDGAALTSAISNSDTSIGVQISYLSNPLPKTATLTLSSPSGSTHRGYWYAIRGIATPLLQAAAHGGANTANRDLTLTNNVTEDNTVFTVIGTDVSHTTSIDNAEYIKDVDGYQGAAESGTIGRFAPSSPSYPYASFTIETTNGNATRNAACSAHFTAIPTLIGGSLLSF
jgi:hypothetical protein